MPALVLEGGSSRVAYTNGVCASLQAAGFVPDAAYGTSAGGAMAAWFATGQAELATTLWHLIHDRSVLSFRRAFLGGHAFDLNALYKHHYPRSGLTPEKIHKVPYPVVVTLTDADSCETVHVDITKEVDPLHVIHCGAAIPLLSKTPVLWNGRRYVDGGMTEPIPLARAIQDGHRDIVLVLNAPDVDRKAESALSVALVARKFPRLRDAVRRHHAYHDQAVKLARSPPPGVRVRIIRPSAPLGISRASRDLGRMQAAIQRGREDGRAALAPAARSDS